MIHRKEFYTALDSVLTRILTNKPNNSISADETFSEYGMDSLDQMNMLLEIETEVGIEIGDIDVKTHDTPAKLYDYIFHQLKK